MTEQNATLCAIAPLLELESPQLVHRLLSNPQDREAFTEFVSNRSVMDEQPRTARQAFYVLAGISHQIARNVNSRGATRPHEIGLFTDVVSAALVLSCTPGTSAFRADAAVRCKSLSEDLDVLKRHRAGRAFQYSA